MEYRQQTPEQKKKAMVGLVTIATLIVIIAVVTFVWVSFLQF